MPYYDWSPYVPVHQRRRQAAGKVLALKKRGRSVDPVVIPGRKIALTFWGKAWCDNLESYSDYSNRLPRGRTYVRNGSVIDLQVGPGQVTALVSGSSIYKVQIVIKPAPQTRWRALAKQCSGKIESVVELLQGRFSRGVMQILASRDTGLFPSPQEISLDCSCPDWATMCKHVAAVLYGVGARLDHTPEMLFVLRKVDHMELVAQAGRGGGLGGMVGEAQGAVLATTGLSDIFGINLEDEPASRAQAVAKPKGRRRAEPSASRTGTRKPAATKRRTAVKSRTAGKARTEPPPSSSASGPKASAATRSGRKKSALRSRKTKATTKRGASKKASSG